MGGAGVLGGGGAGGGAGGGGAMPAGSSGGSGGSAGTPASGGSGALGGLPGSGNAAAVGGHPGAGGASGSGATSTGGAGGSVVVGAAPDDLRVGDRVRPLNVEGTPVFSWYPHDPDGNQVQTAFQIQVSLESSGASVWDSGKVNEVGALNRRKPVTEPGSAASFGM